MQKSKFTKLLSLAVLSLGLAAGQAAAQNTKGALPSPDAQAAAVAAKLKELYPTRPFGAVVPTPISGMFEVTTGDKLSYVDASGTYFLFDGQLVDYKRQVNLTEQRLSELNKIDPATLPLADAIKVVKGNGKRVMYVFSDPNCQFCKKMEVNLKDVDNVTVYTFLYPILQGSKDKAAHVWCANDRAKSWDDLMLRSVQPLPIACDNPIVRNIALGQRLRVSGTPSTFAADGRKLGGAVGAAAVNAFLDAPATKVAGK
jgi:thiol:disulfide interchange protein DsbC